MSSDYGINFRMPRRRRKGDLPPATREEIESAMMEFFKEGGRIEYLDDAPKPGEVAQMKTAQDFTNPYSINDLADIF